MTHDSARVQSRRIARNVLPYLADIGGGVGSGVARMAAEALDEPNAYRLLALLNERVTMLGPRAEAGDMFASRDLQACVIAMHAARCLIAATAEEIAYLSDLADERTDLLDMAKRDA